MAGAWGRRRGSRKGAKGCEVTRGGAGRGVGAGRNGETGVAWGGGIVLGGVRVVGMGGGLNSLVHSSIDPPGGAIY